MKDIPTPESDAARFVSEYITQEDVVSYELSQSLERRLALAVAALKDIRTADDDCVCDSGYSANTVAIETLAQIEEGK
jgi:hypothetical protein